MSELVITSDNDDNKRGEMDVNAVTDKVGKIDISDETTSLSEVSMESLEYIPKYIEAWEYLRRDDVGDITRSEDATKFTIAPQSEVGNSLKLKDYLCMLQNFLELMIEQEKFDKTYVFNGNHFEFVIHLGNKDYTYTFKLSAQTISPKENEKMWQVRFHCSDKKTPTYEQLLENLYEGHCQTLLDIYKQPLREITDTNDQNLLNLLFIVCICEAAPPSADVRKQIQILKEEMSNADEIERAKQYWKKKGNSGRTPGLDLHFMQCLEEYIVTKGNNKEAVKTFLDRTCPFMRKKDDAKKDGTKKGGARLGRDMVKEIGGLKYRIENKWMKRGCRSFGQRFTIEK